MCFRPRAILFRSVQREFAKVTGDGRRGLVEQSHLDGGTNRATTSLGARGSQLKTVADMLLGVLGHKGCRLRQVVIGEWLVPYVCLGAL